MSPFQYTQLIFNKYFKSSKFGGRIPVLTDGAGEIHRQSATNCTLYTRINLKQIIDINTKKPITVKLWRKI